MTEPRKWECSNCGAPATVVQGKYPFVESGLENVYLVGIDLIKCSKCKNIDPIIPNMIGLMRSLAMAVIAKPWKLSGSEIKYLRKYIGMTAEQFSGYVGVDKTTISKWENDKAPVGESSDRLIRAIAVTMEEGLRERSWEAVGKFPKMQGSQKKPTKYNINTETQKVQYA